MRIWLEILFSSIKGKIQLFGPIKIWRIIFLYITYFLLNTF